MRDLAKTGIGIELTFIYHDMFKRYQQRIIMTNSLGVILCDDGNPPKVWVARIKHEFVDGCHIFTSDDVSGLLIASRDAMKAVRQLEPTIRALIQLNHKMNCTVEVGQEFKEFEKTHNLHSPIKVQKRPMKDTYAVIREYEAA